MNSPVADNIFRLRERIRRAAERAGRNPAEVKLMAVTKTVPAGRVREAIMAGVDLVGENYVQEAKAKMLEAGEGVPWHFTGHLQTNKARDAVALFSLIHSLDRIELARELDRRARLSGKTARVLIEVNLAGERSKSGVAPEEALRLAEMASSLPDLAVSGLMTIPPWFDEPEEVRPFFCGLRELAARISRENFPGVVMGELSMGMSHDFEVAVEEGATIVRIGRAIFGPRA